MDAVQTEGRMPCDAGEIILEIGEVAAFVARHLGPVAEREVVPLAAASGRVLAADVIAPMELPPFDQSAVDGYALSSMHLKATGSPLPVTRLIRAGNAPSCDPPGVARVLTGAPVPRDVAGIVMQEHVLREAASIRLTDPVRPGANIRRRGEDVACGEVVVRSGTELDARHVALFAALGCATVPVRPRVRAAILALGDELVAPGAARLPHQINDANSAMAAAILIRHGADVVAIERVHDCADAVRHALPVRPARSTLSSPAGAWQPATRTTRAERSKPAAAGGSPWASG